jgi:hypothetical protein
LASGSSSTDLLTCLPALGFAAAKQLVADWPVGGLERNAAANCVFISGTITFAPDVPDVGTFHIRWHDWNNNGTSDHFLAIDDVQISATPEPGTASMLLPGLGALVGARVRRK